MASPALDHLGPSPAGVRVVDTEETAGALLTALEDAGCRCILDVTTDDVLSAREISAACDLALSTTYRKLELLTDAGLVEERTRIRTTGKHASEYTRLVDDVVISIDADGEMVLTVSHRQQTERVAVPYSRA